MSISLYQDQFAREHDFFPTEPTKYVVIASTPRCGSHMLGHSMYQTKQFGFPLEYLNPSNLSHWQTLLHTQDAAATLRALKSKRTSQNGVFSIKVHHSHLNNIGGFNGLLDQCPDAYVILLRRQNVLEQGISRAVSRQTGNWIAGQNEQADTPQYSYQDISEAMISTVMGNQLWCDTLADYPRFMELDFDQAKQDMTGTLNQIAEFCDIQLSAQTEKQTPPTKRQSNHINGNFKQQFISDYQRYEAAQRQGSLFDKLKRKVVKGLGPG